MFFTAWIHLVFSGFKSQTEEVSRFFFLAVMLNVNRLPAVISRKVSCPASEMFWDTEQAMKMSVTVHIRYNISYKSQHQYFKNTSFEIVFCSFMWVSVCFSSTWFFSHGSSEGLTWRFWLSALKWFPSLVEETCSQSSVLHELHRPSELDAAQIKLSDGLFLVDPGRRLVVVFWCVQTKRIWRRRVAAHSGGKQIPLR